MLVFIKETFKMCACVAAFFTWVYLLAIFSSFCFSIGTMLGVFAVVASITITISGMGVLASIDEGEDI